MKNSSSIEPLPFAVYFWTVFLLGLTGFANVVYLSVSHYRLYTDMGYRSFCAISRSLNCDTVSQSPYSIFMSLPVPVWGIIGFVFFLLVAVMAASRGAAKRRCWPLLICISLFFSVYSIILAFISSYIIHSYCIMCMVGYAINFMLLYFTWLTRKRFKQASFWVGLQRDVGFLWHKRKITVPVLILFLLGTCATATFMPDYWRYEPPRLLADIPTGLTDDGHTWIGAEKPKLVITEFTDYQCFQCRKMHYFLRQLISDHSEKIRLIHRHFPMDHQFNPIVQDPFHVGSGKMALLAISTIKTGHFWRMNDALFEAAAKHQNINLQELAKELGLNYEQIARGLKHRNIRNQLRRDIIDGMRLKITGTPAFVIDGSVYLAQIPPEIIRKALQ